LQAASNVRQSSAVPVCARMYILSEAMIGSWLCQARAASCQAAIFRHSVLFWLRDVDFVDVVLAV
jgi:hypothetical protein